MAFFEAVDEIGIIEKTIRKVVSLEEDEAKKLLKRFKEIRGELRDRLDLFPEDTFSAQQMRGVLVQVNSAINAINDSLKVGMNRAAEKVAIRGNEDLLREINIFSQEFTGAVIPINIDAALLGLESKNFLVNRYQVSIDAYSEDLRAALTGQLTNLSIQKVPFDTMIRKMSRFFLGEEWKLRRIARTELHNVYNHSKLNGMTETKDRFIPDLKKALFHPMDARTGEDSIALADRNLVVDIDKPFRFKWRGKVREFMAPPDRPNDRSILVPFREEWNQ